MTPIWGVELDKETMVPKTERIELIYGNPERIGYERVGENHSKMPLSEEEAVEKFKEFLKAQGKPVDKLTEEQIGFAKIMFSQRPFIEGAWMTKHDGNYYLQYAGPGTEFNVYGDGVYESDSPLGPFHLAKNNPYSYKPGGFLRGAGHGSTMEDRYGNWWHTATMQISKNHDMERRVGIWRAGFDKEGVLFCNQQFGDWPMAVEQAKEDPWAKPEWYLLSYQKAMTASSSEEGREPSFATDENIQTWWRAAGNQPGEWISMDLGEVKDVRAVQINFADDKIDAPLPGERQGERYIDPSQHKTRWLLEASADGTNYFVLADKSDAETNLPHDFIVKEEGVQIRYLKLTVFEVPYNQNPCISGLRVFGLGNGEKPSAPQYQAERTGTMDMRITIEPQTDAVGYNVLWGFAPDKLYHSCMTFTPEQNIGALVEGETVYVRVDAFNENGITEGTVRPLA